MLLTHNIARSSSVITVYFLQDESDTELWIKGRTNNLAKRVPCLVFLYSTLQSGSLQRLCFPNSPNCRWLFLNSLWRKLKERKETLKMFQSISSICFIILQRLTCSVSLTSCECNIEFPLVSLLYQNFARYFPHSNQSNKRLKLRKLQKGFGRVFTDL